MKINTLLFTTILSAGLVLGIATSAEARASNNHGVVHDTRGQVIRNTFGNCVRTDWATEGDECRGTYYVTQARPNGPFEISDEERTVYFEFNRTRLLDSERQKLDSLANELKSMDDISGVNIVGYADRIGTDSDNERLSEQRAVVVEKYLRAQGYLNTSIANTRWVGESGSITQCSDNLGRNALVNCLETDRRVTVEIKY